MDLHKFEAFKKECIQNLPAVVDEILRTCRPESRCAIGFITTDDFYGFYMTWDFGDTVDPQQYFEWMPDEIHTDTNFLYQPLVDIIYRCNDIDFCSPSKEKWDFAVCLLATLEDVIKQLPDEIFQKNNFKRADVLFFATMSDGDYIYEMLDRSIQSFNPQETLEAFGVV